MKQFLLALLIATLYYTPSCPHSKKVLDYVKESKKEVRLVNVQDDKVAQDELQHAGGQLRVPCLVTESGQAIYGDTDIIDWLRTHD